MNSGGLGLGSDQMAEPEDEYPYQDNITERLNNVDDEVTRFYKLNCPTFNKKITGDLQARNKVTYEEFKFSHDRPKRKRNLHFDLDLTF